AAGRAYRPDRSIEQSRRERSGYAGLDRCVPPSLGEFGLERGAQSQDRHSLGGWRSRPAARPRRRSREQPEVAFADSTPAISALQQATRTIPIVFVGGSNPVGSGFVAGLARPEGNITGFISFEPAIGGNGWGR